MKIILGVLFFCWSLSSFGADIDIFSTTIEWRDESDKIIKLSEFQGRDVALTMFYTECKKTCPMLTMNTLKEIEKKYQLKNEPIDLVLITFDPESDKAKELKNFKEKNHLENNWHLLYGSVSSTREIALKLGLGEFWKMDDHILHGFKIYLINKKQETKAIFDWDHRSIDQI